MTDAHKNGAFLSLVPETGTVSKSLVNIINSPLPGTGLVVFDRHELRALMNLYGRQVAAGEWRDYALDFMSDLAVFSVFKRANEQPVFRLEKMPKNARLQGQYTLRGSMGQAVKRGHELGRVLRFFDKPVRLVT
jgi:Protein of unknown function (DUF2794)